ncbi:MAG: M50 family metallopeptidase [Syntrophomonadaceae bacterium]|nr:M50 family metallopeptidase [Syntrophomonadaceae bacterium]
MLCIIYSLMGLTQEILTITGSVLIHEIAHTVTAIALGIRIAEIELFPFGGQAKIEDFTGLDPEKEIYVALAGPVVSLSAAAIFYFLVANPGDTNRGLFVNINLLLGCFNLLPALPLDGGRVLRAVLAQVTGYKKASEKAALMGKIIALCIIAYGIYLTWLNFTGANFIVIGIFLFWAANREGKFLAYTFMRFLVHKKAELSRTGILPARQVVSNPETRVKEVLSHTRPNYYMLVAVVDSNHHVTGFCSEAELIECLFEKGPGACLRDC